VSSAILAANHTAKRFPPNQIHLSLSLPSSLTAPAGPGLDPYASKALLVMEKKLGVWIADILSGKAE
jgi:proteasome assembly chaperone 4